MRASHHHACPTHITHITVTSLTNTVTSLANTHYTATSLANTRHTVTSTATTGVPAKDILALTRKEARDPLLGKKFYDENKDGVKNFHKGEYTVIARDIVGDSSTDYWCEKDVSDDLESERCIERFKRYWVIDCIDKYDCE